MIDKIRAEIERLYGEYKAKFLQNGDSYHLGIFDGLDMAKQILDTLEEPVEKTCKTCGFYENNCPFIRDKFIPYPNKVCKDYTFSTLKAEQEPVSEDLEEEVKRYLCEECSGDDEPTVSEIARHFAEWMKAKMMEGAVEGTVIELGETYKDLSLSVNAKELNQVLQPLGVGDGNKVKIIIVKEEEL